MIVRTWRKICREDEIPKVKGVGLGQHQGNYWVCFEDGTGTDGSTAAAEVNMTPGELDQLIEELQALRQNTPAPAQKIRYKRA